MASLTSQTVAASYTKILITDSNSGLSGTASNIEDGDGTASPLYLSTARLGIGQSSPATTLDISGDLNVTTTSALAGTVSIGGGYGSTGITLSDAGVIQANGAMTIDGASTLTGAVTASSTAAIAGNTTIGGGYGATGVTLSSAGVVQMNGALTVDGASTLAAVSCAAITTSGTLDYNNGTIDLSTQTVDVTLNAAVDALNFDSNTLSIDASNNRIGIGTAAPEDLLHLNGASSVILKSDAVNNNFIKQETTSTSASHAVGTYLGISNTIHAGSFMNPSTKALHFFCQSNAFQDGNAVPDASSLRLTITAGGNVGIGIVAPTKSLHISGTGERGILVTSTDNDSVLELASDTDQGQNSKLIFSSGSSASKATILYDHHDTPASAKMQFLVGDNAVTAATILGNGKVGIGIATPTLGKLQVSGTVTLTDDNSSFLNVGRYSAGDSNAYIVAGDSDKNYIVNLALRARNNSGVAHDVLVINGHTGASHFPYNVGIGTVDPDGALEASKDGANTQMIISTYDDSNSYYPYLVLRKADGTEADPDLVHDNDILGVITFQGSDNDSDDVFLSGAEIIARVNGTPTDGEMPCDLEFWTNTGGTGATQRMTILEDGNVGIGTAAPTYLLDVEGTNTSYIAEFKNLSTNTSADCIQLSINAPNDTLTTGGFWVGCYDAAGLQGGIRGVGGSGVALDTSSDRRLKDGIVDIPDALSIISSLKPRNFYWKSPSGLSGKPIQYGFIADEYDEVFPEMVNGKRDEDGKLIPNAVKEDGSIFTQLMDGNKFTVPVLVKAIQELSAKVTALENA